MLIIFIMGRSRRRQLKLRYLCTRKEDECSNRRREVEVEEGIVVVLILTPVMTCKIKRVVLWIFWWRMHIILWKINLVKWTSTQMRRSKGHLQLWCHSRLRNHLPLGDLLRHLWKNSCIIITSPLFFKLIKKRTIVISWY